MKQDKIESAHLTSTSKDSEKKRKKNKEVAGGPAKKKQSGEPNCFFCRTPGHQKRECAKYHVWRAKKGTILVLVCSEVNTVLVPRHTWWVEFGETTHISVSLQGCLNYLKPIDA